MHRGLLQPKTAAFGPRLPVAHAVLDGLAQQATSEKTASMKTALWQTKKRGNLKVWVPSRLFKLVYDEGSQRAWAYIIENRDVLVERPIDYATFFKVTNLPLLGKLPVRGCIR